MADNYGDPLNRLMFSGDEMMGFQDSAGEIFGAGDITDESQKMLCFGDYENKCDLTLPLQSQISEITCNNNNSSATSCANNGKIKVSDIYFIFLLIFGKEIYVGFVYLFW